MNGGWPQCHRIGGGALRGRLGPSTSRRCSAIPIHIHIHEGRCGMAMHMRGGLVRQYPPCTGPRHENAFVHLLDLIARIYPAPKCMHVRGLSSFSKSIPRARRYVLIPRRARLTLRHFRFVSESNGSYGNSATVPSSEGPTWRTAIVPVLKVDEEF